MIAAAVVAAKTNREAAAKVPRHAALVAKGQFNQLTRLPVVARDAASLRHQITQARVHADQIIF